MMPPMTTRMTGSIRLMIVSKLAPRSPRLRSRDVRRACAPGARRLAHLIISTARERELPVSSRLLQTRRPCRPSARPRRRRRETVRFPTELVETSRAVDVAVSPHRREWTGIERTATRETRRGRRRESESLRRRPCRTRPPVGPPPATEEAAGRGCRGRSQEARQEGGRPDDGHGQDRHVATETREQLREPGMT